MRPDKWRVGRALVGTGLALAAGAAYAPAFGAYPTAALTDPRYTIAMAGAVAVVAAVCILLAIGSRTSPVSRVTAAVAALAGYVLLFTASGRATLDGPRRLLTAALPVEPAGPELAAVVALVGLATLGAVEPALRRRAALLPLAAPLTAAAIGCAVSAPAGQPPGWLAPIMVAGAAALLVLARYAPSGPNPAAPQPTGHRWRGPASIAAGATLLAVIALTGWYGPSALAGVGRPAPAPARELLDQPVQPREATSPLVLFPALQAGRSPLSLLVTTSQPLPLLRYVSLDRFDGEHWTTGAQYRRASRQLPAPPAGAPLAYHEEQVRVVEPGALGWLVSSGRPVSVSVSGLGVDEATGDVVVPIDRSVPTAYTVRTAVPALDPSRLATAVPDPPSGPPPVPTPRDIVDWARQATGGQWGYAALAGLTEYFADFSLDQRATAPGGHGFYQVRRLRETRTGTAEQYASAFAVMARALGYDVRVVVGFRPRPAGDRQYTVAGPDVHAWVEVRFAGIGWVPFDPTPSRPAGDQAERAGPDDPAPTRTRPPDQATHPSPTATPGRGQARPGGTPHDPAFSHTVLALAVCVGLMTLYIATVPLTKAARRRRRRRVADPRQRTVGAWRETLSRLGEAGLKVGRSDTSGEVIAAAQARFGDSLAQSLRPLALLYDEAAFAPQPLPATSADAAWRHADLARRAIRNVLRPTARLRTTLTLRVAR